MTFPSFAQAVLKAILLGYVAQHVCSVPSHPLLSFALTLTLQELLSWVWDNRRRRF
jgi:hypothetical protein